ncbi:MAG: T9SS type A sorting domain-containing protein [Saprospiraceae bacterium]
MDGYALYQNVPIHFTKSTVIGFELPQGGEATLILSDLSGKVLRVIKGEYTKGYNQVELKRSDLPANGVFTYQLKSGSYQAVKKMVLMN